MKSFNFIKDSTRLGYRFPVTDTIPKCVLIQIQPFTKSASFLLLKLLCSNLQIFHYSRKLFTIRVRLSII